MGRIEEGSHFARQPDLLVTSQVPAVTVVNTGFHSVISPEALPDGRRVLRKQYGEKAGGYEIDHAHTLAASMHRFLGIAGSLGIPVVEPLHRSVQPNGHPGKASVVEVVPHMGTDLRQAFSDPTISDAEVITDIRAYLSMFSLIWQNGFPISLDPPPANFCKDEEGRLWYVDSMPPRQRLDDGHLLSEWPAPPDETRSFIERRYFSSQQAQVIYPQLLRALEGRSITPATVKEIIGEHLGPEALSHIDFDGERRDKVLSNPQPIDVDALRIMAAEKFYEDQNHTTLKEVYHLTHIGIGGILPSADQVEQAALLLRPQNRGVVYLAN